MKIELDGRAYQLELQDLSLRQSIAIRDYTGLSLSGWEKALSDDEHPKFLESYAALYWLMVAQNGEAIPIGDVEFPIVTFSGAFMKGAADEAAADAVAEAEQALLAGPDPTQPAPDSPPSPEPSTPSSPKPPPSNGGDPGPDG